MSSRKLLWLVAAAVVLAALLVYTGGEERGGTQQKELFGDIRADEISKIKLEEGGKSAVLELKDGGFTLPDRGGYPADGGRVRSLLFKILGLSVSQKVTDNTERFAALGVNDGNKERAKVTLLAGEKELASLLLGDTRKAQRAAKAPAAGQYIRRGGANDVYLVAEPITVVATPDYWIDSELLNVLQADVRNVKQYQLNGSAALSFELTRREEGPAFAVSPAPKADEELQDAVVSQVASGLENARISDVMPAAQAAEKLKDVKFDMRTEYSTARGLVYTVLSSAEKDGKQYIKVSVRFDQNLANAVNDEIARKNEQRKKEWEEKQKSSASSASASENKEAEKLKEPEPLKANLSSAEEAAKIQARSAQWVYEVAKYQAERFRNTRATLIKSKKTEAASQEANASK